MDTRITKLFSDPPFSFKFVAQTKEHTPLDKPAGALIIALPDRPVVPLQPALATVVIVDDVVTFTLTGKHGEQHFVVSDGIASAGLHLHVKSTLEEDAQLVETATFVPLTGTPATYFTGTNYPAGNTYTVGTEAAGTSGMTYPPVSSSPVHSDVPYAPYIPPVPHA